MTRDWADAPYIRLYATLPKDLKTAALWRDDRQLAAYVRLLMSADLAWPMPQPLPRWLADDVLEALTAAGVLRVDGDTYEVAGLRAERAGRKSGRAAGGLARAETARRAADGTFLRDAGDAGPNAGGAGLAGHDAGAVASPAAVQPSKPARRDETRRAKTSRVAGAREATDEPEGPALTWLARHGCAIPPGNGYHRKLVTAVERHGVVSMIRELERLSAAGMPDGDVKGLLFGAIDALDKARRPSPSAVARVDEQDRTRRAVEATKRRIAEVQSVGEVAGSLADNGLLPPGASS